MLSLLVYTQTPATLSVSINNDYQPPPPPTREEVVRAMKEAEVEQVED